LYPEEWKNFSLVSIILAMTESSNRENRKYNLSQPGDQQLSWISEALLEEENYGAFCRLLMDSSGRPYPWFQF